MPVYKTEKYIYRCIESIVLQTFTDFELILVDEEAQIYLVAFVTIMLKNGFVKKHMDEP